MSATINQKIIEPEIQQFIHTHEHADERALVLQGKDILGLSPAVIADQIVGRRKAKDKLPTWYASDRVIYPPRINLEQSSSEATALFKVELLQKIQEQYAVISDLTGGFGIDSYFLSRLCREMHYVEPDKLLMEIACNNHQQLRAVNIKHHQTSAEDFIKTLPHADVVYIDPSRRSNGRKVFRLSDCTPDIVALQSEVFKRSTMLLIKNSPLLDLQQGMSELQYIKEVFVVSVANECKEVLFLCVNGYTEEPSITAVDIAGGKEYSLSFSRTEEQQADAAVGAPKKYLYEPNASLLKAGAFRTVAQRFSLTKMHVHTHLYSSDKLVAGFPGRIFHIEALVKSDKKAVQSFFADSKANVITRNYPLKPEELKKKLGLKDGGERYLIAFTATDQKYLAVAHRV